MKQTDLEELVRVITLSTVNPNFRRWFKLLSLEDDGMTTTNKRRIHSADFKAKAV